MRGFFLKIVNKPIGLFYPFPKMGVIGNPCLNLAC